MSSACCPSTALSTTAAKLRGTSYLPEPRSGTTSEPTTTRPTSFSSHECMHTPSIRGDDIGPLLYLTFPWTHAQPDCNGRWLPKTVKTAQQIHASALPTPGFPLFLASSTGRF
ncbi:hypothetical protein PHLGIDRAFT_123718 [Phlebiopsis gigantea 11061_1 CR5-6]|uniref:Uncharacterized protein n=1 Tax=Phlebiopsis gigantea (strain 11061_1 CR5-6) TaxID=745531 RepID=A0A0C3RY62_PHLG1|nr:hypothetical protein PHLGIDRAFT_123718 [Phlebiopsis gigantea 11061_1 CR5-6]